MIRWSVIFAITLAVMAVPFVSAQSGADSTIEQQITALNCNYTTVETGLGRVHDSTCPVFAPIIASLNLNGGRPIIKGVYDAAHSTLFRVQMGGVWYVLGSSAELTANGNVWVLDLSGLSRALGAGEYSILAESEGEDGAVRQAKDTLVIKVKDIRESESERVVDSAPPEATDSDDNLVVTPETPQPNEPPMSNPIDVVAKASSIPWTVLGAILAIGLFTWFTVAWRRKKSQAESGDMV